MLALHGVAVLVTRPEQQATPLCRLLESRGAIAVRLPVMEIKPVKDRPELMARLSPIESFDLIIFTSANAVKFGASLLSAHRGPAIAAIGPATARALDQLGLRVTVAPTAGFDSEHLLLDPNLQRMAGRRVLIVKGTRGRTVLQDQLADRGAHAVVAEVYERVPSSHVSRDLAALQANFGAGAIHVVTATSVEIADSLLELASPALRREFARVHWLVPSARVAAALRERGLPAPILLANSAEDHDLVGAIERWRSSESGA